jgi:tetratricopeptide (TPR) repeat protein
VCGASPEKLLEEVRAMQDVGEFAESVEPLRKVLERSPGHPEANYRLGLALVQSGQTNSALWRLERAAESPDFAIAANLALVSLYLGLRPRPRRDRPGAGAPARHRGALVHKVNLEAKRRRTPRRPRPPPRADPTP